MYTNVTQLMYFNQKYDLNPNPTQCNQVVLAPKHDYIGL